MMYNILSTSYSIEKNGNKITYTITHSINRKIVKTKHAIMI